jgi:hypothetical protein
MHLAQIRGWVRWQYLVNSVNNFQVDYDLQIPLSSIRSANRLFIEKSAPLSSMWMIGDKRRALPTEHKHS